jgi:hypothetical protein
LSSWIRHETKAKAPETSSPITTTITVTRCTSGRDEARAEDVPGSRGGAAGTVGWVSVVTVTAAADPVALR